MPLWQPPLGPGCRTYSNPNLHSSDSPSESGHSPAACSPLGFRADRATAEAGPGPAAWPTPLCCVSSSEKGRLLVSGGWDRVGVIARGDVEEGVYLQLVLGGTSWCPRYLQRCAGTEPTTCFTFPLFCKTLLNQMALKLDPPTQYNREGCFPGANLQTPGLAFTWLYKFAVLQRPFKTLRTSVKVYPTMGAVRQGEPTEPVWTTLMSLSCFSSCVFCFINLSHLFLQAPPHCYPRKPTFSD